MMGDEGPFISGFLDQLGDGCPGSVTGAGLDPDDGGCRAGFRRLQGCRVLERVSRHDAVVRVGGQNQDGRIVLAFRDVVIGRIGPKNLEHFGVLRRAVIIDPEASGGELVEAQHVHDAHGGQGRGEQVRSLIDDGPDQKAAI